MSKSFVHSIYFAVIASVIPFVLALQFGWMTLSDVNWLEVFAVFTSYSCTFLCVKQSRWNYPIGAISTAALCLMFYQQGLLASAALNLYLVPTLLYGWFIWGPDNSTKRVESVKLLDLPTYALFTSAAYFGTLWIVTQLGGSMAPLDSIIFVFSIFAQFLLDRKKLETWLVWVVVNVVAMYVYFNSGLYLVFFQFVFFLGNTVYGWIEWNKSMKQPIRFGR